MRELSQEGETRKASLTAWKGASYCSVQFSSVAQSCPTLCDPMDCSTPGLPIYHQLPESTQIHVHWVGDAIQPSYPLSSPSPPALNLSQHQGLFKWVSSSHQVAKVLEFQLKEFKSKGCLLSFCCSGQKCPETWAGSQDKHLQFCPSPVSKEMHRTLVWIVYLWTSLHHLLYLMTHPGHSWVMLRHKPSSKLVGLV